MNGSERFNDPASPTPLLPFDLKVLVLYGVARFRGLIATLAVVGAALGLLFGASQPNVFTAEAKLRYQPSARQLLTDETVLGVSDPDPYTRRRSAPGIPDLLELLRDPVIYEKVAQELGPREILRVDDPSKAAASAGFAGKLMHHLQGFLIRAKGLDDPCPGGEGPLCFQAAVQTLLGGVRIRPMNDTSLVQVTYTATSPQKAKRILDTLVQAYIAHHLEVYGAGGRLEEQKERAVVILEELGRVNESYSEYQKQCGFYDIAGDLLATNEQIRARDLSIRTQEIEASRLKRYVESLEQQLGSDESTLAGRPLNPQYVALVERREREATTIAELEVREVLTVTEQRALERARKEFEIATKTLEATPIYSADPHAARVAAQSNPVIATMQLELFTARARLEAVSDQVAEERKQKTMLEERLERIRACEPQHYLHQTEIATLQGQLNRLQQQIPELESLAYLDQEGRSNLTLFRRPQTPSVKDGPQRSKPVALGLFGGLGLGIGIAALRQLLDRRVRYRETVEGSLGLPVLCVVPEVRELADGKAAA